MNILSAVLGPVAGLAKDYLVNKREEKQAVHERKKDQIKNDANWEEKQVDASANSWKDEFWTIVLAIPLFAIGYGTTMDDPEIIKRVNEGFKVLAELPAWYQYLLGIAITSSFGIKGVKKIMDLRK